MGFTPLVMAAGTAVSAVGQINAGKAADRAAGVNAQLKENQAVFEVQAAGVEAQRSAQRFRRFMGGMRGDIAAQGGQTASGTGLLLAERAARDAMLDQSNIVVAGQNRAKGLNVDATMTRYEGRAARSNAFAGGLATALSGGARIADRMGYFDR